MIHVTVVFKKQTKKLHFNYFEFNGSEIVGKASKELDAEFYMLNNLGQVEDMWIRNVFEIITGAQLVGDYTYKQWVEENE